MFKDSIGVSGNAGCPDCWFGGLLGGTGRMGCLPRFHSSEREGSLEGNLVPDSSSGNEQDKSVISHITSVTNVEPILYHFLKARCARHRKAFNFYH